MFKKIFIILLYTLLGIGFMITLLLISYGNPLDWSGENSIGWTTTIPLFVIFGVILGIPLGIYRSREKKLENNINIKDILIIIGIIIIACLFLILYYIYN